MKILIATNDSVVRVDADTGAIETRGHRRVTCLAWDPWTEGRAWAGSRDEGVLVSDDGGATWRASGLADGHVMSLAPSPARAGLLWAGTEPSAVWRSVDGGRTWKRLEGLEALPSSSEWSFPPRPDTHHVRWIAPQPADPDRVWAAIEAGALISTADGGRTWNDRVPGGPRDTHHLAIHPDRPELLRSAAGDGYFESDDGGATWTSPMDGLDVGYLRSVAIDPGYVGTVIVSAATHAHRAYRAGHSDGRLYRRQGAGRWQRVVDGWPEPPTTIAPLLAPGGAPGELYAADERGLHRSRDGGVRWEQIAGYGESPRLLHGLAVRP